MIKLNVSANVYFSEVVWMSVKSYCQTAASVWRRARAKTIQVDCVGSMHGNLHSDKIYSCVTLMIMWHGRLSYRQNNVQWQGLLQVSTWHDCSYTAWIPRVNLSYSILAGWNRCMSACVVTYMWAFKWKLLLAQTHPSIFLVVSNPVCIYLTCYKSNSLSAVQKNFVQIKMGCRDDEYHFKSSIRNAGFLYTSVKPPICLEVN